jgi:Zn-dependent protease with chaperone function
MQQMDFREHQEHARKNSKKIWMLYLLLLLISSALTGLLFGGYFVIDSNVLLWSEEYFMLSVVFSAMAFIVLVISTMVGFFKNSNGKKVAQHFGGQLISADGVVGRELTKEEKRALNIIEELSLAAAISVPPLYLIPDPAINAFAAGKKRDEAIVAITQGALEAFDRKEMTGIIAHELGHVVSDDIRMNIRVSALVYGFTAIFVIGRLMLNGAIYGRGDGRTKLIKLGLSIGILAVGLLSVYFGRVLQAAMSRQREYLADASAIQFTRHPDGLKSAFKKIKDSANANTNIETADSSNHAHAFIFGIGGEIMATHPPLDERIARLSKRVV